eukprot:2178202-Amphidinium_carterae.1
MSIMCMSPWISQIAGAGFGTVAGFGLQFLLMRYRTATCTSRPLVLRTGRFIDLGSSAIRVLATLLEPPVFSAEALLDQGL